MGCGTSFVKYVLFFFNLIVALFGLAVIAIGVAVLLNWAPIAEGTKNLTVAPWVFIIIGAIMFVIAFFGCCGAIRESHCMVVTYAIFLLVIIIVQVILAVLLFTYSSNIKEALMKSVGASFDSQQNDVARQEVYHSLEMQISCCGNRGPEDYGLRVTLPASCCPRQSSIVGQLLSGSQAGACTIDNAFQGCSQRVGELYEKWNKVIAGVAIGVACIEVVGALFALCLANSIRNMDRRSHY